MQTLVGRLLNSHYSRALLGRKLLSPYWASSSSSSSSSCVFTMRISQLVPTVDA